MNTAIERLRNYSFEQWNERNVARRREIAERAMTSFNREKPIYYAAIVVTGALGIYYGLLAIKHNDNLTDLVVYLAFLLLGMTIAAKVYMYMSDVADDRKRTLETVNHVDKISTRALFKLSERAKPSNIVAPLFKAIYEQKGYLTYEEAMLIDQALDEELTLINLSAPREASTESVQ